MVGEDLKDPGAAVGIELDAGGVEDLGDEVAAEQAPEGAVGGAGDDVVAAEETEGGESGEAVGEGGSMLDEGSVGEGAVGDEDGGAGAYAEGDNWAILTVKLPEDGLHLLKGSSEPEKVADDRHGQGARGEPSLLGSTAPEEKTEGSGKGKGEQDEEPNIHVLFPSTWLSLVSNVAAKRHANLYFDGGGF